MTELLVYEIIRDFREMGIYDIPVDEDLLTVEWVDDLEFMEEVEEDENNYE